MSDLDYVEQGRVHPTLELFRLFVALFFEALRFLARLLLLVKVGETKTWQKVQSNQLKQVVDWAGQPEVAVNYSCLL